MIVNINRDNPEVDSFVEDYMYKHEKEIDKLKGHPISKFIGEPMFKKLYEGSYDNHDHEIKLEPFEWINYALLRRYMTRKTRDKALLTPPPPPLSFGGRTKRRCRRRRCALRRTSRRRTNRRTNRRTRR